MASEPRNKTATSIALPVDIMEQLDTMARDDRRDRSAEIAYLAEQEWKRRNPDPTPLPQFVAARKAAR